MELMENFGSTLRKHQKSARVERTMARYGFHGVMAEIGMRSYQFTAKWLRNCEWTYFAKDRRCNGRSPDIFRDQLGR